MRGVCLPLSFARPGDVVDADGWGRLVVVVHVWQDEEKALRILYLNAAGQRGGWRCLAGASPTLYARVGQGCRPTAEGLQAFILERLG
jgi:hypothetical protein